MQSILESLPAFYRRLMPEFFHEQIPNETKATCANCAMCEPTCGTSRPIEAVDGVSRFFKPETKCCTYHPNLPNFLVGAVLNDESAEMAVGRARITRKIEEREGVYPAGIQAPMVFSVLYQNSRNFFGKASSLRCPYYDDAGGGLCSIWRYRESVCSTYYCKHEAGADGRKFWMSMKSYLTLVEVQLSRYALLKLHPDYLFSEKHPAEQRALSAEDLDGYPLPEKSYAGLWGEWLGREQEFYKRSHELVTSLTPADLQGLLGLDGTISQGLVEKSRAAALSPVLPDRLKLNPSATVQWQPDGSVAMASYSELDGLALPGEAYFLLKEFTGHETVPEVRSRLRKEKQADFSDEVLMSLYRQRVLTNA